jgi:gamma-glutamyltranspeptidase/glutathione hydrolase
MLTGSPLEAGFRMVEDVAGSCQAVTRRAMQHLVENWIPTKPAKVSADGVVVAQHAAAAAVGAEILASGGNAVDAAVATAFALGVVEPWMSGVGGSGYLVFGNANSREVKIVDFGLIAAAKLDPSRYKVTGGVSTELFGWPLVEGDRNLKGYESICVPGSVDGLCLALETFGRKKLPEIMAPAIRLAEQGLPIDWYSMLQITVEARALKEFPSSQAVFLPDGMPPVPASDGSRRYLRNEKLAATYRRLAAAGRRDFYEGEIAASLVADFQAGGSAISAADLKAYQAKIVAPHTLDYRGVRLHAAPELTGGPTFLKAMAGIDQRTDWRPRSYPDASTFLTYAEAIREAFAERFKTMGYANPSSHTTHLSVADREGNMVALTNTLLSRFGSKVVLPGTGITMNNGMMWFDPRSSGPNALAAGKRPLANMCPVVATRDGVPWAALGASGGRRIIPAIVQLASLIIDFNMPLEKAFAVPRLDASTDKVLCDNRFPPEVIDALAAKLPVQIVEEAVYPGQFANPSAVMKPAGSSLITGMAHIHSPAAAAATA